MRVLLEESLPRRLKQELAEHEVTTVPEAGWAGKTNGDLLRLAEPDLDVFVTMDRQLPFQQNLAGLDLCVIILVARSNDISALQTLLPALQSAVGAATPRQIVTLRA